jgi:hypothetical protein
VIKPTVGRVVLFHPSSQSAESGFAPASICAAIVAFVHSDSMVNLAVFDANGVCHSKTSVRLVQDGETGYESGYWCEWMPYQKGQAAKTEALEAAAKEPADFNELKRMARAGEPLIDINKDRSKEDAGRIPK